MPQSVGAQDDGQPAPPASPMAPPASPLTPIQDPSSKQSSSMPSSQLMVQPIGSQPHGAQPMDAHIESSAPPSTSEQDTAQDTGGKLDAGQPPDLISQPPSQPFSLADSTDAIALQAVISSLQIQKQRAEADIRTLRDLKDQAVSRPQEFADYIVSGAAKRNQSLTNNPGTGPLPSNFTAPIPEPIPADSPQADTDMDSPAIAPQSPAGFPAIPAPQEIVRCPPINWAKYHIVGAPLDAMHAAQQVHPGSTTHPALNPPQRPAGQIAAAYDPLYDRVPGEAREVSAGAGTNTGMGLGVSGTVATATAGPKRKDSVEFTMQTRRASKIGRPA